MKKRTFKSVIHCLFIIALFGLVVTSCNNEDPINEDQSITFKESAYSQAEIDDVSEGVNDIIENVYFDIESQSIYKNEVSKSTPLLKFIPECVTITKVITTNTKNVTIDFGDGCTLHNGNILSGQIIMDITYKLGELKARTYSSFNNFYFNGKKVEGNVSKTHTIVEGIPEANIKTDIKIIWEDETFATVIGERKRVWIEGLNTLSFHDNVFLVSGNWTITKNDGSVRNVSIADPLRREMSCRFVVSGVVKILQGEKEITVNYGDGECDDLATALIDGETIEFHIGRRK